MPNKEEIKKMKEKAEKKYPNSIEITEPTEEDKIKAVIDLMKKHWAKRFYDVTKDLRKGIKAETKGFNYKYCTLQSLMDQAYPLLSAQGLMITQVVKFNEECGRNYIETHLLDLLHKAESVLKSQILFPDIKLDEEEFDGKFKDQKKDGDLKKKTYENCNQALGSTVTYMRRYALYVMLGILPEEDKDGKFNRKNQW